METLLQRIAWVSQSKSDSLRNMIIGRIQPSDSFLSTVEYELRSGDNVRVDNFP